jgi:hypothetical protein
MRQFFLPATLLLSLALLSGCQDKTPQPGVDMNALRLAVQKKTEQLYLIHLKLDTAAADITKAELKAQSGDCSDAEYLAAEAYRNIEKADQSVLELGRELQELFNLDIEGAGGN